MSETVERGWRKLNTWRPHTRPGRKSEEEGAAERRCYVVITNSIPYLPALLYVGVKG